MIRQSTESDFISEKYVSVARKRIDKTFVLNVLGDKNGIEAYEEDE